LGSTQSNPEQWDDSSGEADRSQRPGRQPLQIPPKGGNAWIAPIDKGSVREEAEDEEDEDEDEKEDEEEEEDKEEVMNNLLECMGSNTPGQVSFGCRSKQNSNSDV